MPHTVIDDADPDALISRLSRPLAIADREDFRRAAEDAVRGISGAGALYRTVASLQRSFRIPPTDHRAGWDIEQELRPTKLKSLPPIEHDGDGRHTRYRK
jgi:hypothetical protein